jgi:hypothetical protein
MRESGSPEMRDAIENRTGSDDGFECASPDLESICPKPCQSAQQVRHRPAQIAQPGNRSTGALGAPCSAYDAGLHKAKEFGQTDRQTDRQTDVAIVLAVKVIADLLVGAAVVIGAISTASPLIKGRAKQSGNRVFLMAAGAAEWVELAAAEKLVTAALSFEG